MNTRELFRQAVDWIHNHPVLDLEARPAFTYHPSQEPFQDIAAETPRDAHDFNARARSMCDTARAIREGALSSREVVSACLERIAALNGELRAFVCVLEEQALKEADWLDRELKSASPRGPLHGVPLSIKDVIHVAGVPTTASSQVLQQLIPADDACAVQRLKAAGAIVIGKTETHEFALGVTTPQSRNPWDVTRIPGGSTGGTAIAIATGMAPGGLGTDTRASIRVPAALSGVVGFKPTFGLVPTHGVVTLSWSMDHVAPMGTSVADVALLLDVIAGTDRRDPNSVDRPPASYLDAVGRNVSGLRIGVPKAGLEGAEAAVEQSFGHALEGLKTMGCAIRTIEQPSNDDLEMTNAAGLIVSRAEAATLHQSWLEEKFDLYSAETRDQLDEASRLDAVTYLMAQRLREQFRLRMLELFSQVDLIAMPTSLVLAPAVEEADQYLLVLSRNCIPWSFIGFPAISVPCGRSAGGLPIGFQLVGAPFRDDRVIAAAAAIERLGLY